VRGDGVKVVEQEEVTVIDSSCDIFLDEEVPLFDLVLRHICFFVNIHEVVLPVAVRASEEMGGGQRAALSDEIPQTTDRRLFCGFKDVWENWQAAGG
jgi:hypothetical protein